MSFFTDASFVMDPNVYGVGKLYVPKPTDGSGDLTFSRASTGTRVNQDGLIEKVRTNLLLQSNSFDTTWTTSSASVTGGQSGYDGSSDAWLLESTGASGSLRQSISSSAVLSYSFYAKAGNVNYVRLRLDAATEVNAWFLLSGSGSVGTLTNGISSSIESVGGGWYRVSVNANATSLITIRVYPSSIDAGGNSSGNNVYIQDAQLETGDIATDYIPTTTSAVSVGPLANIPRLNYGSDGCPSLLLEPQRTNLATYSEQFDNVAWVKQNAIAVTANTATSPDGYTNADTLEKASGSGGSSYYYIVDASTSNTTNTFSVFAKYKEGSGIIWLLGKNSGTFAYFNLQTGTALSASAGMTTKIENYGNEWYRCSFTQDYTGASDYTFGLGLCLVDGAPNYDATSAATQGAYIYGAQFEAGAYATSYIPTLGSAVTRLADVASKTGISSLIGQTEGTIFVEAIFKSGYDTNNLLLTLSNTSSNMIYLNRSTGQLEARVVASGVVSLTYATPYVLTTGTHKVALAYKENDFAVYLDGTLIHSDTSGSVPACNKLNLGTYFNDGLSYNDGINQALLFKTRLSNADLARLTSL
jgi:hypothetical protein